MQVLRAVFAILVLMVASCSNAEMSPAVDTADDGRISLMAHPGGCRGCHEGMGTTLPSHPPPANVCSDCHAALADGMEKQHGPFALGDCLACHVPHASSFPALGRRPEPELCSQCHSDLLLCPGAHRVMDHGNGLSRCTACHGAHGGSKPYLLLDGGLDSASAVLPLKTVPASLLPKTGMGMPAGR